MLLYVNGSLDAPFNLALEETLAAVSPEDFMMLWRNDKSIIIGRNQNMLAEIDTAFVEQNRIPVVRRMTGGGAVYHDCGNLNYTICVSGKCPGDFARFADVVCRALNELNCDAEFSGRNDILCRGRKVSGSASSIIGNRTLFHGTLLFNTDLEMLSLALAPDPEKVIAKGIRSVRSRVMNLHEILPDMSMEQFIAFMRQFLESRNCRLMPIPEKAVTLAEQLADRRYRSREWNAPAALPYSFRNRRRFPAGKVELAFNVSNQQITQLDISGDFFGEKPAAELACLLEGIMHDRETLARFFRENPPAKWISGVPEEELLELFF